tara:strand:- start:680 stop:1459 length:780 start_codon:yes stop_codon:yes gene_type:complete
MQPIQLGAIGQQILKIENLSVRRSGKTVIKDIDLKISKGEFVAIVGPNGSGKSTLLLAIVGALKLNSGSIQIYGLPPVSGLHRGRIGWVSQAASYLPKHVRISVRELVSLGTLSAKTAFCLTDQERVTKAIQMVDLEDVQDVDVSRLSGGQRQRAVIARALASDAEFILLDEPLVGIDRDSRNSLLKLLDNLCYEENKTILMVSHDLTAMRKTAHRMIFLEETIRFDGPTDRFPDLDVLAELRGINPASSCIETDSMED